MTDIPDEIVRRLVALARHYAPDDAEARALVALLPEPVDPDLVEAEVIYKSCWANNTGATDAIHAGIRRGRELANQERKS